MMNVLVVAWLATLMFVSTLAEVGGPVWPLITFIIVNAVVYYYSVVNNLRAENMRLRRELHRITSILLERQKSDG